MAGRPKGIKETMPRAFGAGQSETQTAKTVSTVKGMTMSIMTDQNINVFDEVMARTIFPHVGIHFQVLNTKKTLPFQPDYVDHTHLTLHNTSLDQVEQVCDALLTRFAERGGGQAQIELLMPLQEDAEDGLLATTKRDGDRYATLTLLWRPNIGFLASRKSEPLELIESSRYIAAWIRYNTDPTAYPTEDGYIASPRLREEDWGRFGV